MEGILNWVRGNLWFILFFAWGIPLGYYRSRFRKIVYETDSWTINIKPVFVKETKALIGNMYPGNPEYIRFRNFYRLYLGVYGLLFAAWRIFG
jgi:peroxiredoxin Q/BCP